jgi:diguanylate cyclase (GGDEF)-like protein/PAS domain S-box-containing protein
MRTDDESEGLANASSNDASSNDVAREEQLLSELQRRVALEKLQSDLQGRLANGEQRSARDRLVFDLIPFPCMILDRSGMIRDANHQACRLMLGVEAGLVGQPLTSFSSRESLVDMAGQVEKVFKTGESSCSELELRGAHGSVFAAEIEMRALPAVPGEAPACLVALHDVSERKAGEQRLVRLIDELRVTNTRLVEIAHVDALTGLGNRRAMERCFSAELARAKRTATSLLAVLVDCDDFKSINDHHGHASGDVVLRCIAGRLKGVLRPTDALARIGGDEFLLLLPETSYAEGVVISERLRVAISAEPVVLVAASVTVTISLGVVRVPHHARSIDEVLSLTHLSLKRSKSRGKNRVSTDEFPSGDYRGRHQQLQLTTVEAIERLCRGEGIRTLAQPIIALGSGEVVGLEMLSRASRPIEMPTDFFRAAIDQRSLTSVDLNCMRQSASLAVSLERDLRYHINVFPATLLATPHDELMASLRPDGRQKLCVELSQQQMVGDPATLKESIMRLRREGVEIAIDEVGFGRSSLESLILLEPAMVKIDRKFFRALAEGAASRQACERLVRVLDALDIRSVAVGIEGPAELEMAREIGIHAAQGFLIGAPTNITTLMPSKPDTRSASSPDLN